MGYCNTLGDCIINLSPFFNFNDLKEFVKYRMHDHDKTREEPYAPIRSC